MICYLHFALTSAEVAAGLPLGDLEVLMELHPLSVLFVNTSSICQRIARRMAGQTALLSVFPELPWFYTSVAHPMVARVFHDFLVRPGCALPLGRTPKEGGDSQAGVLLPIIVLDLVCAIGQEETSLLLMCFLLVCTADGRVRESTGCCIARVLNTSPRKEDT